MCEDDVYTHTHSPPFSLSLLIFSPFRVPFCPTVVLNNVIIQFISFAVTTNLIMKLKSVFIEREKR